MKCLWNFLLTEISHFRDFTEIFYWANNELIIYKGSQAPASSPQHSEAQKVIEMNINEEDYERPVAPKAELQPLQSIIFIMPENFD